MDDRKILIVNLSKGRMGADVFDSSLHHCFCRLGSDPIWTAGKGRTLYAPLLRLQYGCN
jgi:hypothetical protein